METQRKTKVLVVAGGTRVRIDDVRYIGNFSKGKFGASIAGQFAWTGAETHLLTSEEGLARIDGMLRWVLTRCAGISTYVWFEDLESSLFRIIAERKPDIVVMAAAVSDYLCADPVAGKIRSDADELTIRMKAAPKLISRLREACGVETFVIGFKLLARATREELIGRAREQLKKNRLNLVVANMLDEIGSASHPITLVTPEGGAIPVSGTHGEVARALVEFALKRQRTTWTRTRTNCLLPETVAMAAARHEAGVLLEFAIDAGLLGGSSDGNVSVPFLGPRAWRGLVVTPRGAIKNRLGRDDLISAEFCGGLICAAGPKKPSIDTAVHAMLYSWHDWLYGIVHFHDSFVLPHPNGYVETAFPYPCGTLEEAQEIDAHLRMKSLTEVNKLRRPWMVRLKDHGYLLLLDAWKDDLPRAWDRAKSAYVQHLDEVGEYDRLGELVLRPIWSGPSIIGVIATKKGGEYSSVFLLPGFRGHGHGAAVTDELCRRKIRVKAKDDCNVVSYYRERGWRTVSREGAFTILEPPTMRDDLRDAATVCLLKTGTEEVLLGERLVEPMKGVWCFPGGSVEPFDNGDFRAAAHRELFEETGMTVPADAKPIMMTLHYFGGDDGRAYRVHNFVIAVDEITGFSRTAELAPAVYRIDTALQELKILSGTKRVLHLLKKRLADRQ